MAWRGGVRAPSLLRPLDPLPFPSSSSSPSHSSLFLFSRSAQVVYAPAKVVFRVTMLKAMSYICKANARSFARVSASTRSRAPSCVRACVRTCVRANTGRVACESAQWRGRGLGKNCRRFDEKLGYLTETKLGLEVSRGIGCASPTTSSNFDSSDSKIV